MNEQITVKIKDIETGIIKELTNTPYQIFEGNFSCDCNRSRLFEYIDSFAPCDNGIDKRFVAVGEYLDD
jgi:redox-regulated HSP33 family molecular chaperone